LQIFDRFGIWFTNKLAIQNLFGMVNLMEETLPILIGISSMQQMEEPTTVGFY
jgi:hypothetical protein